MMHVTGALLLALAILFSGGGLHAQTADDTDTVVVNDAAVMEENADEENEDEDQKEERFIPRGERDHFQVNERKLPDGYANKLKKDKDFWYADTNPGKKVKKEEKLTYDPDYVPFMKRGWVQTLLWIIIVGGFAFAVLWYLVDSKVGLFRKKRVATDGGGAVEEEMPEDIFAIQYQKEIARALAQGNYRLAIRIQFLRTLKNLADKKIIQYKQDKTNFDYLMELSKKSWYPAFLRITRHFEYSWYGHFDVAADTYHRIAGEFDQFEKQV